MDWFYHLLNQINLVYIGVALFVGFMVGMTGVGGGSLMTPILLAVGITPAKAVGTDLICWAIAKTGGMQVHQKRRNIDWRITGYLALGSIPGALLTLWLMHQLHFDKETIDGVIKSALGVALLLTAVAIFFKAQLLHYIRGGKPLDQNAHETITLSRGLMTSLAGLVLGAVVTVTSIGAGALGTVALFLLFPTIPTVRLVGTEITHAVPLTLVAGLGHAGLGNLDYPLLFNLLAGTLPGIYVGSHLAGSVPDKILRPLLAAILLIVGMRLVW